MWSHVQDSYLNHYLALFWPSVSEVSVSTQSLGFLSVYVRVDFDAVICTEIIVRFSWNYVQCTR